MKAELFSIYMVQFQIYVISTVNTYICLLILLVIVNITSLVLFNYSMVVFIIFSV